MGELPLPHTTWLGKQQLSLPATHTAPFQYFGTLQRGQVCQLGFPHGAVVLLRHRALKETGEHTHCTHKGTVRGAH